jgi:allophanate hydrolase
MINLSIGALRAQYLAQTLTPRELVDMLLPALEASDAEHIWINRVDSTTLYSYADRLAGQDPASLPLYGIPFAIKDNIDLTHTLTTAGCPAFAYTPQSHAFVVQCLIDAGAIPIGKTNLDQFATGLAGTRSPYGACRNALHPDYISGGSSAGSAVAVASSLVSFSLGTDTAGSGRVPAMFNNLIGLKPTLGLLSGSGVVPACRTLDCVSIFALTAADAADVLKVAARYDDSDAFSRAPRNTTPRLADGEPFRFGVPSEKWLHYFGNKAGPERFAAAVKSVESIGGVAVEIDFAAFAETARLLYEGPWVAERYAAISEFIELQPESLFPVFKEIVGNAKKISAVDAFKAQYRLADLKRRAEKIWADCDILLTPTAPTTYTIAEVNADPIRLNSNLGYYTNFMNLLNLCAIAVPAGFQTDGLPFGVTIAAPEFSEDRLLGMAAQLHRATSVTLGAHCGSLVESDRVPVSVDPVTYVDVAVCGAHMSGLPLNHQLTNLGARFKTATTSAENYQLYALPGGPPARPGMVRATPGTEGCAAIELEVWRIPMSEYGRFVAGIPAPLGIGRVQLADGSSVQGFVCEAAGIIEATNITDFGGWRAYLASNQ